MQFAKLSFYCLVLFCTIIIGDGDAGDGNTTRTIVRSINSLSEQDRGIQNLTKLIGYQENGNGTAEPDMILNFEQRSSKDTGRQI